MNDLKSTLLALLKHLIFSAALFLVAGLLHYFLKKNPFEFDPDLVTTLLNWDVMFIKIVVVIFGVDCIMKILRILLGPVSGTSVLA